MIAAANGAAHNPSAAATAAAARFRATFEDRLLTRDQHFTSRPVQVHTHARAHTSVCLSVGCLSNCPLVHGTHRISDTRDKINLLCVCARVRLCLCSEQKKVNSNASQSSLNHHHLTAEADRPIIGSTATKKSKERREESFLERSSQENEKVADKTSSNSRKSATLKQSKQ